MTPVRAPAGPGADRGSGTLWVLVLSLLIWAAAVAAVLVGGARADRHRAVSAADLAAISAAGAAARGEPEACAAAAATAAANGARLTSCTLHGLDAVVEVVLPARSLPGAAATARARAGPHTAPPDAAAPPRPLRSAARSPLRVRRSQSRPARCPGRGPPGGCTRRAQRGARCRRSAPLVPRALAGLRRRGSSRTAALCPEGPPAAAPAGQLAVAVQPAVPPSGPATRLLTGAELACATTARVLLGCDGERRWLRTAPGGSATCSAACPASPNTTATCVMPPRPARRRTAVGPRSPDLAREAAADARHSAAALPVPLPRTPAGARSPGYGRDASHHAFLGRHTHAHHHPRLHSHRVPLAAPENSTSADRPCTCSAPSRPRRGRARSCAARASPEPASRLPPRPPGHLLIQLIQPRKSPRSRCRPTFPLCVRQRICALNAEVRPHRLIGALVERSLIAYGH